MRCGAEIRKISRYQTPPIKVEFIETISIARQLRQILKFRSLNRRSQSRRRSQALVVFTPPASQKRRAALMPLNFIPRLAIMRRDRRAIKPTPHAERILKNLASFLCEHSPQQTNLSEI